MAAVAVVFDDGSSVRQRLMASAMDYDERTRRWRTDRQHNNQPIIDAEQQGKDAPSELKM